MRSVKRSAVHHAVLRLNATAVTYDTEEVRQFMLEKTDGTPRFFGSRAAVSGEIFANDSGIADKVRHSILFYMSVTGKAAHIVSDQGDF